GAFFHVITHAFFKALLFLGAGSVIHAMSDEQDMRSMGGLRKHLPITYVTMLIATIAIAGIPPLSGFFSKDEILAHAFADNKLLWVLGFIGALFTAFYMFRMLSLTFFGKFRGTTEQAVHLHEPPATMTIPLVILAALSAVGGLLNLPSALGGGHALADFLAPVFADSVSVTGAFHLAHSTEYVLMAVSAAGAIVMAVIAYRQYAVKGAVPAADDAPRSPLAKLSYQKFYVDEAYDIVIVRPLHALSVFFYRIVDRAGIDGLVNGLGKRVGESGHGIRLLQTGNVGSYIFMMVIAVVALLAYGFFNG